MCKIKMTNKKGKEVIVERGTFVEQVLLHKGYVEVVERNEKIENLPAEQSVSENETPALETEETASEPKKRNKKKVKENDTANE